MGDGKHGGKSMIRFFFYIHHPVASLPEGHEKNEEKHASGASPPP